MGEIKKVKVVALMVVVVVVLERESVKSGGMVVYNNVQLLCIFNMFS